MNKVGFRNSSQVALWNAEMRGQISDGHWENAGPHDHWKKPSSAEGFVAIKKEELGPDFHPRRTYSFNSSHLHDAIGDRMLFIGKIGKTLPKLTSDEVRDVEGLTWKVLHDNYTKVKTAAEIKEAFDSEKDDSWFKKNIQRAMKALEVKDEDELAKAYEKIIACPYSVQDLKKDLRDMTKIFSNRVTESISSSDFPLLAELQIVSEMQHEPDVEKIKTCNQLVEGKMSDVDITFSNYRIPNSKKDKVLAAWSKSKTSREFGKQVQAIMGRGDPKLWDELWSEMPKKKVAEDLDEAVFAADQYDWYVWKLKDPIELEKRGRKAIIRRGTIFGLRSATSAEGKYRVIIKQLGPTHVFSVDQAKSQELTKGSRSATDQMKP